MQKFEITPLTREQKLTMFEHMGFSTHRDTLKKSSQRINELQSEARTLATELKNCEDDKKVDLIKKFGYITGEILAYKGWIKFMYNC